MTLTKAVDAARDKLKLAQEIFTRYHDNHMAKTPPDVNKALSNSEAALDMADGIAALPDKPMTEDEITQVILKAIRNGKYNDVGSSIVIFRALKAANVLFVKED